MYIVIQIFCWFPIPIPPTMPVLCDLILSYLILSYYAYSCYHSSKSCDYFAILFISHSFSLPFGQPFGTSLPELLIECSLLKLFPIPIPIDSQVHK